MRVADNQEPLSFIAPDQMLSGLLSLNNLPC